MIHSMTVARLQHSICMFDKGEIMLYLISILIAACISVCAWACITYSRSCQEHALLYIPVKDESKEENLPK